MVVNMKATGLLPSIYGLLLRWTLISLLFKKKKKIFLVSIKPQTFLVSDAVFLIPVSFVLSHFTGFKACFVYLVCKNKTFSTNLLFIQIFMAQAANLLF